MTIQDMSVKEFQELVEGLINNMKMKGLINAGVDTKTVAKSVTEELQNDKDIHISGKDLKNNANPELIKSVGLACIAKSNPAINFDIKLLFKPGLEPDEVKDNLKNLFTDMLKLYPKKDGVSQEEMDKKIDEMAELLTNKFLKDKDSLVNNDKLTETLLSCMTVLNQTQQGNDGQQEMFRQLYGVNPIPGGIQPDIQEIPNGNQMGLLDMAIAGLGKSFMAQVDNPDPAQPDPGGVRMGAMMSSIANGEAGDMRNELIDLHILDSNAPQYKPNGHA